MTDTSPPRRRTARSAADLLAAGLVGAQEAALIDQVGTVYSIAVTPSIMDLLAQGDADPIARQFIPSPAELEASPGELSDPIGDDVHSPVKGIVHRYADRVLLKPIHVCPVYCRFCFRREMVGHDGDCLSDAEMEAALDYIRARPEIWEVILTGGDPMMLPPARMQALLTDLAAIPHVEVIRLHTRVPVTDPARVSPAMVAALKCGKAVWVALHANHASEFTPAARAACAALVDNGIPMLGQSVLLKGVNDDKATLTALMRAYVANRIKPYYLHHGDMAPGTAHFRTSIAEGQELMKSLRGDVSGLCQPTYMLDIPGGHGKVPVGPNWLRPEDGLVEDPKGGLHRYPPGAE
ncbi:lysine-2,3-aminomutase-like protein [Telmatospirillum sp. J64-1]|uniref:lysine-2,3-aminomutase-like protein n=1 Tax=Telmatospirillum sp. J64-1 TaxID=2502183 RepID=UPI00115EDA70|nr:lysine-2,3-aminomutase-like protein [Telmatospirillum sp. J64-1]